MKRFHVWRCLYMICCLDVDALGVGFRAQVYFLSLAPLIRVASALFLHSRRYLASVASKRNGTQCGRNLAFEVEKIVAKV